MENTSEQYGNSTLTLPAFEITTYSFGSICSFVTTSLCLLIGVPAHLCCLWFYFWTEQKIKVTHVFWLNHTVMELTYCLECSLYILNMFVFKNDILWYVIYFFLGLAWSGRPLLQICICIEQYMAVIHPVIFLKYKDIKYRIAATVVVWLMGLAYSIYETNVLTFPNIIFTPLFGIAMVVALFCCVSLLCALKQPGPADTHSTKQPGKDGGNQQKRNAFNTIFAALLLILFTYLPQVLLVICVRNQLESKLAKYNISSFMASLNDFGVIIPPLVKMYKKGHFKLCKQLNGN